MGERAGGGRPAPRLRPLHADDVAAVMAVERAAYGEGWPSTAFERELTRNPMARYIVVEDGEGRIVGFAGLWLMVDEAHVVTVAVLPQERRGGLGRLLVHGLIQVAIDHGMTVATLEVRESNAGARALYREYGFYEVGRRKRYYADNHEDAVIMTTEAMTSPAYQRRLARLAAELARRFPGMEPRAALAE